MSEPPAETVEADHPEVQAFWELARFHARLNAAPSYFGPTALESVPPPAWSFGETAADADEFVAQVLADKAGETRAAEGDYDGTLPDVGVLSILCDGTGRPRALVETTGVEVRDGTVVEALRVVYAA